MTLAPSKFFSADICIRQCFDRCAFREEDELYVLHSFCTSVGVGDDSTGPKVSENSWKRRRKGRNIRDTDFGHHYEVARVRSSLAARIRCTVTALRLK